MRYAYSTMQHDASFDLRWLAWWLKIPNFITIIDKTRFCALLMPGLAERPSKYSNIYIDVIYVIYACGILGEVDVLSATHGEVTTRGPRLAHSECHMTFWVKPECRYDSIMSLIAVCNTTYALTDVYPIGYLLLEIDCILYIVVWYCYKKQNFSCFCLIYQCVIL